MIWGDSLTYFTLQWKQLSSVSVALEIAVKCIHWSPRSFNSLKLMFYHWINEIWGWQEFSLKHKRQDVWATNYKNNLQFFQFCIVVNKDSKGRYLYVFHVLLWGEKHLFITAKWNLLSRIWSTQTYLLQKVTLFLCFECICWTYLLRLVLPVLFWARDCFVLMQNIFM